MFTRLSPGLLALLLGFFVPAVGWGQFSVGDPAKKSQPEVANPEGRLAEVESLIDKLSKEAQSLRTQLKAPGAGDFTVIPLKNIGAVEAARILNEMLNSATPASGTAGAAGGLVREDRIRVVADTHNNKLLIRAALKDMTQITSILSHIDTDRSFSIERPGGNICIITLSSGNAMSMAEVLQDVFAKWQPDQPVRINGRPMPAPKRGPGPPPGASLLRPSTPAPKPGQPEIPPGKAAQEEKGPREEKKPPIDITVIGNSLIVSCDDPKMLSVVEQAISVINSPPAAYEIIPLRNISAADGARMLDGLFNRPKSQAAAKAGGEDRIQVVADSHSNRLLVRASALDMHALRKFVKMIDADADQGGPNVVIKTHYLRIKEARAMEVAEIIRDVYRESIEIKSMRDAAGTRNNVALLSVTAIERTNTLVLGCPESMYEEIVKNIIKPMEEAALTSRERKKAEVATVHTVSLKEAKAATVAKVLQDLFTEKDDSNIRIAADPASNSLFIRANEAEMRMVEEIIRKMDVRPGS